MTIVELETYRRKGHAEHDNQSYIADGELARWERDDPIDRYIDQLTTTGWSTPAEIETIDNRIDAELEAVIAEVDPEPMPDAGSALDGVYQTPPQAEREWYCR